MTMTANQAAKELRAALLADQQHRSYKIQREALRVAIEALERRIQEHWYDCGNCKHRFRSWDAEPCDSCTEGHSNFEEATE